MHSKAKFTVIIPNYNGLKYMEACMAALKEQTYTCFDVLIVDNGSTDGSVEYLQRLESEWNNAAADVRSGSEDEECSGTNDRYIPRLRNIFLDSNTGFSGAVNTGIAASDTEYVVLLNNDTEADKDYLKELAEAFEGDRDKRIFAVSPKMIQLYHKEFLDDAGDGYNLFGWAFQRGVGQSAESPRFNKSRSVFSACAGAAAYRRSVFDEIVYPDAADAYFDPMHFAYLEDVDVSFRARTAGYDIIYAPRSKVYHVGSGTSGSKYNSFKVRLAARNNIFLNYKNMPLLMLLINLPGIVCGMLIKQLFFVRIGFGADYAAGVREGLSRLGECRRHKTAFRMSRLTNYIHTELMLICDTFSYIRDFAVRQAAKLQRN